MLLLGKYVLCWVYEAVGLGPPGRHRLRHRLALVEAGPFVRAGTPDALGEHSVDLPSEVAAGRSVCTYGFPTTSGPTWSGMSPG